MSEVDPRVQSVIDRLELAPHPEGGFYLETYRSPVRLATDALGGTYPPGAERSLVTSILFLLPTGLLSRLHRVRSEEIWLHHEGDPVRLAIRSSANGGRDAELVLGRDAMQAVVPRDWWQEAEALPGPNGYALVGCVVAPGFEFEDFEITSIETPSR